MEKDKEKDIQNDEQQDEFYIDFSKKEESNESHENNENNVNNEKHDETNTTDTNSNSGKYEYKEKEYNSGFLESHTKVTGNSIASRFLLFGFYLIFIVLGVIAFIMIRSNRYEFYLKQDEVVVAKGGTYQLELIPKDIRYFDYLNYNYSIADTSVATVDEFGTVTAVGTGETTLKISLSPGFNTKTMRIIAEDIDVDNVELLLNYNDKLEKKSNVTISKNQSINVKASANGRDDLNVKASYTSSDETVAKVDEFGNVTAVGSGTAVISGNVDGVTGQVDITVSEDTVPVNPVSTPSSTQPATPKPTTVPIVTPEPTDKPEPTVKPTNTPKPTAVPTLVPGTTATPTPKATATPKPTATPKATATPKPTATPKATAKPTNTPKATAKPTNAPKATSTPASSGQKVTKVTLSITDTNMYVGGELSLSAVVEPNSIKNYTVKWKSSNDKVATVKATTGNSANAKVNGLSVGTAVITAEVDGIEVNCTVRVKSQPSGKNFDNGTVELDKTSLTIKKGKTGEFKINVPEGKGLGTLSIKSNNTSIATVDLPIGDVEFPTCSVEDSICFLDGLKDADSITITVKGVKEGTTTIDIEIVDFETINGETVKGSAKVGISVE